MSLPIVGYEVTFPTIKQNPNSMGIKYMAYNLIMHVHSCTTQESFELTFFLLCLGQV